MKNQILSIAIVIGFLFSGCAAAKRSDGADLMENVKKSEIKPMSLSELDDQKTNRAKEITQFSLDVFRQISEENNTLISPLSIVSALGMTANGAKNNTLSEMEKVMHTDLENLNRYLKAYAAYLPNGEKYKVSIANSIWFKEDKSLRVEETFLQTNKDYYDANIYQVPFDDHTKDEINEWVSDKTSGMIQKLLEEKPPENAIMYLINALSFDGEWEKIYEDTQISDGTFALESGEKQKVEFMQSMESSYLETDHATGLIKSYQDGKYAFVALLPKANMKMSNFLATLDGENLINLIKNAKAEEVYAKIPKFTVEYSTLLNDPLQHLGMTDAFDGEKADFSRLGNSEEGNIFISNIIHKTKIEVNERGTKAGAVTSVEMKVESARPEEPKKVVLDRPFFYMIIDTEQKLPLFMGTLMSAD